MLNEDQLKCMRQLEETYNNDQRACDKNLTTWEADFLTDIMEKFTDYEDHLSLSPKQWDRITIIYEKLYA